MNTEPVPGCWRSEAFAEDLLDSDDGARRAAGSLPGAGLLSRLIGLLPLTLAAVTTAFAAWRSTAA